LDLTALTPGLTGHAETIVADAHTARAMGSGSEAVFATPAMVALMEQAAVAATADVLPAGLITLGTHIAVDHLAASRLGAHVSATARLIEISGRALTFSVEARDGQTTIGRGTHVRSVVEGQRFLDKLASAR
jgi:fluoroacetyl-CoA thioesterase